MFRMSGTKNLNRTQTEKLVSRKKKIDILPKSEKVNILALRFMKLSIYWSITNLMHLMSRLYSERIQWKFIGEKNASLSLLASFHSPQHFLFIQVFMSDILLYLRKAGYEISGQILLSFKDLRWRLSREKNQILMKTKDGTNLCI